MCFLTYVGTRVPNGIVSSYGDLAAVLPVVIISAAGVTTLVVTLICCVGYKLNYKYVRLQYPSKLNYEYVMLQYPSIICII